MFICTSVILSGKLLPEPCILYAPSIRRDTEELSLWTGYGLSFPFPHTLRCLSQGRLGKLILTVTTLNFIYRGLHQVVQTRREIGN